MSIKLIIFDFDGTLGDTRLNIVTTMQMAIKELQLPERSEAECASTIGLPLAGCFRTLFPDIQDDSFPAVLKPTAGSSMRIFRRLRRKPSLVLSRP
jgi:Predicted phosphatases